MQIRGLRRLCSVAATSVLLLCCACADEGVVPAVGPESDPEPLPEQAEPFLTVSPDTLFYDLSGNPLNASGFTVKTNCLWRLSVPKQADWFEASATSGRYDDSVSFHLNIDRHYHVAELLFGAIGADGKPVISRSVVIQQGEETADPSNPDNPDKPDNPSDPNTPDNPDEKPGDDPSNPDNPDKPDNPCDPDTPDNPDDKPGDNPSNPDNPDKPDNPSDPDKEPEIPPATPSIPKIESVNPTALVWSATDSRVTRQVSVTVADFDSHVLQAKISGADTDRFEASVNGLSVFVKAVGPNETDADYRATLEISVEGGNCMNVSLVQSKRESVPDNDDSGDNSGGGSDSSSDGDSGDDSSAGSGGNSGGNPSDSTGDDSGGNSGTGSGDSSGGGNGEEGGEPEAPQGGGCDDFSTLTPNSQCKDRVTTSSGWAGFYCAVYSGDNGSNSAPYFRSLLGRDSDVKGLAMRRDSKNGGRIESPELHGGCGTLTFRYGVTEANKSVDFTVEIVRNGASVMSWPVQKPVKQWESNVFSEKVQCSGDFRIVIRNNSSSNAAYTTVFQIAWSGYSGNRP